jgi:hypothetical protein
MRDRYHLNIAEWNYLCSTIHVFQYSIQKISTNFSSCDSCLWDVHFRTWPEHRLSSQWYFTNVFCHTREMPVGCLKIIHSCFILKSSKFIIQYHPIFRLSKLGFTGSITKWTTEKWMQLNVKYFVTKQTIISKVIVYPCYYNIWSWNDVDE